MNSRTYKARFYLTNPVPYGTINYSEKTNEVIDMTVYVKDASKSVLSGLSKMKAAMIEDYAKFMPPTKSDTTAKMNAEYVDKFDIRYGTKYIKIVQKDGGVKAFVVGVDNDKKFKLGDILLPAGYNAPARNLARGNILDGDYTIAWTGALYAGGTPM